MDNQAKSINLYLSPFPFPDRALTRWCASMTQSLHCILPKPLVVCCQGGSRSLPGPPPRASKGPHRAVLHLHLHLYFDHSVWVNYTEHSCRQTAWPNYTVRSSSAWITVPEPGWTDALLSDSSIYYPSSFDHFYDQANAILLDYLWKLTTVYDINHLKCLSN